MTETFCGSNIGKGENSFSFFIFALTDHNCFGNHVCFINFFRNAFSTYSWRFSKSRYIYIFIYLFIYYQLQLGLARWQCYINNEHCVNSNT
jgi:hypothetical protein